VYCIALAMPTASCSSNSAAMSRWVASATRRDRAGVALRVAEELDPLAAEPVGQGPCAASVQVAPAFDRCERGQAVHDDLRHHAVGVAEPVVEDEARPHRSPDRQPPLRVEPLP
jgi:hypothetical protein